MTNSPCPVGGPQVEKNIPLDTRLLSQMIIELTIARKNILIYPFGHIRTTQGIDRVYELLSEILAITPEITIGVAKDTLLIGQDYLDHKNPVFKEFSLALSQYDIAGFTIFRGLDRGELLRFLRTIIMKPEDIRNTGGMDKVLPENNVSHVSIRNIDYGGLHLTEEQEIIRPRSLKTPVSGTHIWRDFVTNLLENRLLPTEQGISLDEYAEIDPKELARFINELTLDSNKIAECYDQIITRHLTELRRIGRTGAGESENHEKFITLIKELRPELRRQFLSMVLGQCTTTTATEAMLSRFPDELVLEMIQQSNEEGRTISPSLMKLITKLSAASNIIQENNRSTPQPEEAASEPHPKEFKPLFEEDNREEYVDKEYEALLSNLVRKQDDEPSKEKGAFRIEDHLNSLEEDQLDFQIARALLAFINEDIGEEEYEDFSRTLLTSVDALLNSGRFEFLNELIMAILHHGIEKQHHHIRSLAERSLKHLLKYDFFKKAIVAAKKWERDKEEDALCFLRNLGPAIVPSLIAYYLEKNDKKEEDIIVKLLCHFKETTLIEAKKGIQRGTQSVKRNFAFLINQMGENMDVPLLKQMLEHPHEDVRTEALDALLRMKDPWAIILLRKWLNAKKPETFARAVSLAGKYQIAQVVSDLIKGINQTPFFKTDYAVNETIIHTLGRIGDPRAIPVLERLCKGSWSFSAKGNARVRRVIFESLECYPHESIKGLIAIGRKSKDEGIKEICQRLVKNIKPDTGGLNG